MKRILWLNNHSCPKPGTIHIYNYNDLKADIMCYGLPDEIWFGHELGEELNGTDCAKWLVKYCSENSLQLPIYHIQYIIPEAKEMLEILDNFREKKDDNNWRFIKTKRKDCSLGADRYL